MSLYNCRVKRHLMNYKDYKSVLFHALVKIDIFAERGKRVVLRDTGYGTDHACEGCFSTLHGRREYTFGTPALYIAEKPDLPGNKNFFLRVPLSPVDMQPFINTPFPSIHLSRP